MRSWLPVSCLVLVLASVAILVGVGLYYLPLQVDGGWYSYPAYAYNLGRDPFSYQADFSTACHLPGFKALFQFETTSSIRVFYASAWFHALGSTFLSLKILTLLELSLLFVLAYLLFRRFFEQRAFILLATGFVVTDKTLGLEGVSDSRPDLALAAASVGLFLVLCRRRSSPVQVGVACLLAAITALIAPTSAVPLSFVLVACLVTALWGDASERKRQTVVVLIVAMVAVLAFFARPTLFRSGLSTAIQVRDPVNPLREMIAVIGAGPWALFGKELRRWGDYFLLSNVVQLAVLLASAGALLFRGSDGRRIRPKLWGPLCGLAAAMLVLGLLDPHSTGQHLVPVAPFMLLLLASFEGFKRPPVRALTLVLGTSAILGIGLMAKIWRTEAQRGTNNWWLQSTLAGLTSAKRTYLVVGPTELWPYFPKERDILLLDLQRNPRRFNTTGVSLADADYVVLNRDYDAGAWRSVLRHINPRLVPVVDKPPVLTVWRMDRPDSADSDANAASSSTGSSSLVDRCRQRVGP